MNPPSPRLETIEIELAVGVVVSIPAATTAQAEAFEPPHGLCWASVNLLDTTGAERAVQVLARA